MSRRPGDGLTKELGRTGEDLAAGLCRQRGMVVLEQNYSTPFGEIDIIAKDRDVIVFVEVKARSNNAYGAPFEAVTPRKREKIKKVAMSYLKRFRKEVPVRFDVISISLKGSNAVSEYIQDAFEV